MLTITSSANGQIKHLKKLQTKKTREQSGEFVVENLTTIIDAAQAGHLPQRLYLTPELLDKVKARLPKILAKLKPVIINQQVNKHYSSLATPSGITAVYEQLPATANLNKSLIYFNAISDPGNLGALLRSAMAFGLTNVVLDEDCADLYNPKTLTATKEAIFKLQISVDHQRQLFQEIKKNLPVYATSLQGKNLQPLLTAKKYCLVLGNEAKGVSAEIIKTADQLVKIPMTKNMNSLNVAIAGSIIFYELHRAKQSSIMKDKS
ncbi:MAG: RNA methyltransferase [bacterium]